MAGKPLDDAPVGVVIWGASGHSLVVREALEQAGLRVEAVFDNNQVHPPFTDVPLFVAEDGLHRWLAGVDDPGDFRFVIAVGGAKGRDRVRIHRRLEVLGLKAHTTIHPTAFVATGVACGAGAQVLAMAAVCAGAEVGSQSIVNTAATVDHECVLGIGVHLSPGAHLAGLVKVGDYVTIGTGAAILPRVQIGVGATVGAGAVVLEDVQPGATVVGNPARPIDRTDK
jgi:sugar O-acyltransferase (sialic acid O-acetyltransferase NeuD family)